MSLTNDLFVYTNDSVLLDTIVPNSFISILASASPNIWTTMYESATSSLQEVYNGSTSAKLKIDSGIGQFNIMNNSANSVADLFSVYHNDGGDAPDGTHLAITNINSGAFTPALSLSGGSATAANSVAIGNNSTSANIGSLVVSDGTISATSYYDNQAVFAFSNGFNLSNGPIMPNTYNSDANYSIIQGKGITSDGSTSMILNTIPIISNSTMMINTNIVGCRTGGASGNVGDSWTYHLEIRTKNINDTLTKSDPIIISMFEDIEDIIDISFKISGTNLVLEVVGITGNVISWIANNITSSFKWDF